MTLREKILKIAANLPNREKIRPYVFVNLEEIRRGIPLEDSIYRFKFKPGFKGVMEHHVRGWGDSYPNYMLYIGKLKDN